MPEPRMRIRSPEAESGGPRARGLAVAFMRAVARRPFDTAGALAATAFVSMTVVNALHLQSGPHPAPLMAPAAPAPKVTGSLVKVQPSRPAGTQASGADPAQQRARVALVTDIQRELGRRGFYDGPIDGIHGSRMDAGIRAFEQAAGLRPTGEPTEALLKAVAGSRLKAAERAKPAAATAPLPPRRPEAAAPAPAPAPSKRVMAAQRALTDFGYGPVRPTGVHDEATRAAVERFERARQLPVKGHLSDRVLRELATVTGRPFE